MRFVAAQPLPMLARWTSRLALFSTLLIITAIFLHRLFGMPTPVAYNVVTTGFGLAFVSLVLAVAGGVQIWQQGGPGTARVVFGIFVSGALLMLPLAAWSLMRQFPPINDLTTDFQSPPPFNALASVRSGPANGTAYPGEPFAKAQAKAFPDIRPILVHRSREEAFELAVEALKRLSMKIVAEKAPGAEPSEIGLIEAVDRTLVLGFYDDVAVRVDGDDERATINVRSAARYGTYDYGRNAERLRAIAKEIGARVEATVATVADSGAKGKGLKQGKDVDPKSAARRRLKGRVPPDALRGPGLKVSPPQPGYRQYRDKRPGQSGE